MTSRSRTLVGPSAALVLALAGCGDDPPGPQPTELTLPDCSACGSADQPSCTLESAPASAADSCLRPLVTHDGTRDLVIS